MTDSIIRVDKLGKRYRIGVRDRQPDNLREAIADLFQAPFRYIRQTTRPPTEAETLWALKDVSFEVRQGEVLGIIGRNGAGKSTLLKILSRITEPTEGRAIIHGQIGSLLEVGTGFHPELTGRENVFLNGAILGMKRADIERRFDEIVDFAEVEKFIDTPVKRYSSGMYVRLAFAVAAHLEPDVLIVDEVLAVGDALFQRKCLGKMETLSSSGRTVLFVSHNIPTIQALCHRVVMLHKGRIIQNGKPDVVVDAYMEQLLVPSAGYVDLTQHTNRITPSETAVFQYLRLCNENGRETGSMKIGEPIEFELGLELGDKVLTSPIISVEIQRRGVHIGTLATQYMVSRPFQLTGAVVVRCRWQPPLLAPGDYSISRMVIKSYSGAVRIDAIENFLTFEISPQDIHGTGKIAPEGSIVVPTGTWEFLPAKNAAAKPV